MSLKTVSIIGNGTMGLGIAYLFAKFNWKVTIYARNLDKIKLLETEITKLASKEAKRSKLVGDDTAELLCSRVSIVNVLNDVKNCTLVVEAIPEDINAKKALMKKLSDILSPSTIVATNTSSLSITELASVYQYPEMVIGLHFFNPAPVMGLVEVIKGFNTKIEVIAEAKCISEELGKKAVFVDEYPGFIVNRLLMPMINEAVNLLDCGVAELQDIDLAMKLGANHPIGPLALADMIGIDVVYAILETLFAETGEHRYKPSYTLKKMCLSGYFGRKTKQGFYSY